MHNFKEKLTVSSVKTWYSSLDDALNSSFNSNLTLIVLLSGFAETRYKQMLLEIKNA